MPKVYIEPAPDGDRAINRVIDALKMYAPERVEFVERKSAELVIIHVVGRKNALERKIAHLLYEGKKYVLIQYSVRSTQKPETGYWLASWKSAELVWSYYDLNLYLQEDGHEKYLDNFYHTPLGVDQSFKQRYKGEKLYKIMTHGRGWTTESIRECGWATKNTSNRMLHLGEDMKRPWVDCVTNISDVWLSHLYGQCEFVAGLRRTEGFELPAAEGLICGARPILFDRLHYRKWYNRWGIFIPEGEREEVIQSLEEIFKKEIPPVSEEEIKDAKEFFDWKWIIKGFWDKLLYGDND
jgi:hypothetical protein